VLNSDRADAREVLLMKKITVITLATANILALVYLLSICSAGQAAQLSLSDLSYGAVDLNGDGQCEVAEDEALEKLLERYPGVIEAALQFAKVKADGTVDLSPYLMQFGLKDGVITLYRNGKVVTFPAEEDRK
jgi:hypothetical protein